MVSAASMSATPHNPALGLTPAPPPVATASTCTTAAAAANFNAGHEALQALLAFSSLHEQIKQRRAREMRAGGSDLTDVWELEQFVLDEVLQLVAERALTITGADGVAIAMAERNAIICRASAGTIAPDPGIRLDPNSGFSGACLRTGRIIRCDDSEIDPRVNVQVCRRLDARSLVAVPIAGVHGVVGLLEAFSSEAYGFNDSDVRSLSLLAELVLAAMKPEEEDRLAKISKQVVAGAPEQPAVPAAEQFSSLLTQIGSAAEDQIAAIEQLSEQGISAETPEKPTASPLTAAYRERSRPGLFVALILVILAVSLGAGMWWKFHRDSASASVQLTGVPTSSLSQLPLRQNDILDVPSAIPPQRDLRPLTHEQQAGLPSITNVRHVSSTNSSTVIIELQRQVQYEAHRIASPDRIYFDLLNTALPPGLFSKTIDIEDALITRVRIAQPLRGVSRVVLETKGVPDFSVRLEGNPYRLVIEVSRAGKARHEIKTGLSQKSSPDSNPRPLATQPGDRIERVAPHTPKLRIALDAGHGGWDIGTVGRMGLMEKDLALDIVSRLGKLLERRLGAQVIYTRNDDSYLPLEKRAEIANLAQADLFVSIHANYSTYSGARGVETYYTNTYSSVKARTQDLRSSDASLQNTDWTNLDIREKVQESRRVALSVQQALYRALAASTPGTRNRGVKNAAYVVLTGTMMPAILAEVSFVSSPEDENKLQNPAYRQRIAEALAKGISRYSASRHVTIASASPKPAGM
jgi:N-acetylmuramoyl-L-alanine amidase